jgi:hypothetical protein
LFKYTIQSFRIHRIFEKCFESSTELEYAGQSIRVSFKIKHGTEFWFANRTFDFHLPK